MTTKSNLITLNSTTLRGWVREPSGASTFCSGMALAPRRLDESPLLPVRNLVAALFRLDKDDNQEVVSEMISVLAEWLKSPEQTSLRRAFTVWISRVLLPQRMRGIEVPEFSDLQEVKAMLQNAKSWPEQWEQKGLEKGLEKGLRKGLQEGEVLVLKRLLQRRFGILPDWAQSQLEQGKQIQLEEWADRILDAKSLEDVFLPT